MGDYVTSLLTGTTTTTNTPAAVTNMQDDLLIEKQSKTTSSPLSPGGGGGTCSLDQDKTNNKDFVDDSTPSTVSEKDITCSTNSSSLQSYVDVARAPPNLWAAAAAATPDDNNLHALPVNGSIAAFQNFPSQGGGGGLFGSNTTGTRRAITASHNFPQHPPNNTNPGGQVINRHNTVQQQTSPQQQQPPGPVNSSHPGVYLPSKGYAAWSGGPQTAGPPQQWGGGTGSSGTTTIATPATLSPWNRGRSVPNLPPMHTSSLHAVAAAAAGGGGVGVLQGRKPSPTFPGGHPGSTNTTPTAHPSCISPVKFRRSTSYPGKSNIYPHQPNPTFEVTAAEDRDIIQMPQFQHQVHA